MPSRVWVSAARNSSSPWPPSSSSRSSRPCRRASRAESSSSGCPRRRDGPPTTPCCSSSSSMAASANPASSTSSSEAGLVPEGTREGRRVGRALLRVVPLGLAVMAVNYAVDPAHVFGTGAYEHRVAGLLLDGRDVGGLSNFDDRRLQQLMAAGLSGRREVVALGSSRVMQIRAELFPGARFYNAAVSGATLEDDVALYGLMTASGRAPARIVLGLDPW